MNIYSEQNTINHATFAKIFQTIAEQLNDAHPDIVPTVAIEMNPTQSPEEDVM